MKKPLYTEGPWQVITGDYNAPGHGTHLGFAIVTQYPSISIGSVHLGNTDRIEPIRRANAQLMATSPELVDALQESHELIKFLQSKFVSMEKEHDHTANRIVKTLGLIEDVHYKATDTKLLNQ